MFPVFLMLMLVILYGILAQVHFDHFEEILTRALFDSTTQSLSFREVTSLVRPYEALAICEFELSRDAMTLCVSFKSIFRRRWVVHYDTRLPSFESLLYVTDTGSKFHRFGCRHLNQSMIPLPASEALVNFSPCGVCSLN
ncbi:MAG: hypothetical protein AVO33_05730 [delta proteobacterium ML8_F1]|nr:MAG: hypothetical protein AVO33_05730 [delta proteobacterium ML8_F1]